MAFVSDESSNSDIVVKIHSVDPHIPTFTLYENSDKLNVKIIELVKENETMVT